MPASQRPADPSLPDHLPLTGTNVGVTASHWMPNSANCQYTTYFPSDLLHNRLSPSPAGPSFLIILRIDSPRFGIVPRTPYLPIRLRHRYGNRLGVGHPDPKIVAFPS